VRTLSHDFSELSEVFVSSKFTDHIIVLLFLLFLSLSYGVTVKWLILQFLLKLAKKLGESKKRKIRRKELKMTGLNSLVHHFSYQLL